MRVAELATDLGVSPTVLLSLLRTLRISATDKDAVVSDGDCRSHSGSPRT